MLYGVEAQDPASVPSSSAYSAKGVHFAGSLQGDGTTYLRRSSLACTDNGFFSFSLWCKGLCTAFNERGVVFVVDEAADYIIYFQAYFSGQSAPASPFWELGTIDNISNIGIDAIPTTGWHHVLGSSDIDQSFGNQIMVLYVDDVLQTPLADYGGAADINPVNGKSFIFGDDTFDVGPTCDFADVWIAPGVSLLDTGGTIPDATRRLFTTADLRPIDPTTFPSSAVLFTGGASAFATNRGTGGAFTLTGSLTNASTDP